MNSLNYKKLDNEDLNHVIGGKIIRTSPWSLYNTKTHKTYADQGAIWRTVGHTIVNGWLSSFGR